VSAKRREIPVKSKGGRPRINPAAAKGSIFPIRLSLEERAAIAAAAERADERDSEWARRVLLAAASAVSDTG
jgi:hypothetical protein